MKELSLSFDQMNAPDQELLEQTLAKGGRVPVLKNDRQIAVVISKEELDFFDALENQRDLEEAQTIMADDTDEIVSWDEAVTVLDKHAEKFPKTKSA